MKSSLRIFVAEHCSNCDEAYAIAAHLQKRYPNFKVEIIDVGAEEAAIPEAVFATPTYMLGDRIVSLGNPSLAEAISWIDHAVVHST